MRKMITLILALILTLTLAACNGGGSSFSGVDTSRRSTTSGESAQEPGGSSEQNTSQPPATSNTPATSQPPEMSKPSSRNLNAAEKELEGIWILSASGFTTNIEFKSDGTYYSIVFSYSNGTYNATHMRGNFSAENGIYILTNLEVRSGKRTEKPTNMELIWTWTDEWHSSSTPSHEYYYAVGTDEKGKYLVRNQNAQLTGNESKWR